MGIADEESASGFKFADVLADSRLAQAGSNGGAIATNV
jgi:hypothetical protein